MRHALNVDYATSKMAASRRRLEARTRFRYVDRVPVAYCVVPRYFAPLFGVRYLDFLSDVEEQFRLQLEFEKYRIERIPEDHGTAPVLYVHPWFDNVIPPSGQGGEVGWVEDGPPRESFAAIMRAAEEYGMGDASRGRLPADGPVPGGDR